MVLASRDALMEGMQVQCVKPDTHTPDLDATRQWYLLDKIVPHTFGEDAERMECVKLDAAL